MTARTVRGYMRRAMELASRGAGRVSPNPLVGAVVVRHGEIVGEGYHAAWGKAHAEVVALAAAGESARGADLYVTLEPCNHVGKTGRCTDRIAAAGVRRVYVGTRDPNPHVRGGGVEKLRAGGIEVRCGILEEDVRYQNRFYLKHVTTGLPFVILKWAMTLDGYAATADGDSRWISSEESRRVVHRLRSEVDAVLVGVGTVLRDDPLLTCRGVEGGRDPVRVVIDPRLRTPADARLFSASSPLLFIAADDAPRRKRRLFAGRGAECVVLPAPGGHIAVPDVLRALAGRDITSVLVEGGGVTAGRFVSGRAADEVVVFCAPCLLGGGLSPVRGDGVRRMGEKFGLRRVHRTFHGGDVCIRGLVTYGPSRGE